MPNVSTLNQYEDALRDLLERAAARLNQLGIDQFRAPDLAEHEQAAADALSAAREAQREPEVAIAAEALLTRLEALETELDNELSAGVAGGQDLPSQQRAALMGSVWVAADACAAVIFTEEGDLQESQTKVLREQLLSDAPEDPRLRQALGTPAQAPSRVALQWHLEHSLPDLMVAIAGRPPARGGSERVRDHETVLRACTHVIDRLTATVNSTAASAFAGVGGPLILESVDHFVRNLPIAATPATALTRLKKALVAILEKAVLLAKKIFGAAAITRMQHWLKDRIPALARKSETRVVADLLKVPRLLAAADAALTMLPEPQQQLRLAQVEVTSKDFDEWDGYGSKGLWALRYCGPWLSAINPLLVLVPAVALLTYSLWIAVDHLDWPKGWPLPDRAVGVAGALGL